MVDIAFGPEQGQRPDLPTPREAYLDMVRRKRMYGGILLVIFVALMASGWHAGRGAQRRRLSGRACRRSSTSRPRCCPKPGPTAPTCPAIFWDHIPALIETLNIAAVATLLGALAAMALSLLATRGLARWPAPDPALPPHAWTRCAPSRKSSSRWC